MGNHLFRHVIQSSPTHTGLRRLPLRPGDPHHSAWGLWKNPALGALNYLTDEVVLRAAKEELQTGERVTLKYARKSPLYGVICTELDHSLPLDAAKPALLGRIDFEQKLINKAPRLINDDVVRSLPSAQ